MSIPPCHQHVVISVDKIRETEEVLERYVTEILHCPSYPNNHCEDHSGSCSLDKYLFPTEQFLGFRSCTQIWKGITLPSPQLSVFLIAVALRTTSLPHVRETLQVWTDSGPYANLLSFGSQGAISLAEEVTELLEFLSSILEALGSAPVPHTPSVVPRTCTPRTWG